MRNDNVMEGRPYKCDLGETGASTIFGGCTSRRGDGGPRTPREVAKRSDYVFSGIIDVRIKMRRGKETNLRKFGVMEKMSDSRARSGSDISEVNEHDWDRKQFSDSLQLIVFLNEFLRTRNEEVWATRRIVH